MPPYDCEQKTGVSLRLPRYSVIRLTDFLSLCLSYFTSSRTPRIILNGMHLYEGPSLWGHPLADEYSIYYGELSLEISEFLHTTHKRSWFLWSQLEGCLTPVRNEVVLLTTILVQRLSLPTL